MESFKLSNPNGKVVDFDCKKGEAVFNSPIPYDRELDIQNTDKKLQIYMEHVAELKDDRLVALTADLLIENSIDNYLSAIMPEYKKEISKHYNNFTLSVKISIAKALRLSPIKLFENAVLINEIRNQFVHHVEIKTFSELSEEEIRKN